MLPGKHFPQSMMMLTHCGGGIEKHSRANSNYMQAGSDEHTRRAFQSVLHNVLCSVLVIMEFAAMQMHCNSSQ